MLASVLQIPNEPEPVADQTENLAAAVWSGMPSCSPEEEAFVERFMAAYDSVFTKVTARNLERTNQRQYDATVF
jgi:hypothetical protein